MPELDTDIATLPLEEVRLLSAEDRVKYLETARWLPYPRANQILRKLHSLLHHPRTHRMPCLALVGHPNNGKTMLLREFQRRQTPRDRPLRETARVPVVYAQAPPQADRRELYDALLNALDIPYRYSESPARKVSILIHVMREVDVGMVIIDEFHQATAAQRRQATIFMDSIKHLSNEMQIPIVLAGIERVAFMLKTEAQFASRFEVAHLPAWKLNNEFARLLVTLGESLPLRKPPQLATPEIAPLLHSMSDGYIGELTDALKRAAARAILSGGEIIDASLLRNLGWASPSARKKALNTTL